MNGDSGASLAFDMRAVGSGALWGVVAMLLGSVLQGVLGFRSPLTPGTEAIMSLVWQALGALLGGFLAARRAPGSGWLHGAAAGLTLVLALTAVNGVATALPPLGALAKAGGLSMGVGALGGVAGVNLKG